VPLDTNPFNSWATVLDCGDIPVTSYVRPPCPATALKGVRLPLLGA
jgi:hypothetical protein